MRRAGVLTLLAALALGAAPERFPVPPVPAELTAPAQAEVTPTGTKLAPPAPAIPNEYSPAANTSGWSVTLVSFQ